ncbi:MAG TPA: FKBP-type peptidyl-prolyl cis-trans isomerase [Chitinophagaceae bacterium]|jgi:FKBP-type peptidyl-prolyl cis-trans isomerase FklB|nr:FKBP-type peptidyl-prolyl cis-trans isomerase [Chitinophagaceae bacterium]
MKKTALICVGLVSMTVALAQPVKPVAKPAPKPAAPLLKNLTDSASYAIGLSVANFYKQQGIKNIKANLVTQGINDVMGGKKTIFDETVANNVMNNYMSRVQEEKSKPRIDSGLAFCAKNKQRPEVKTTPSGLQYEVLIQGAGEKPTAKDSVTCHYRGALLDGTPFDNSYDRGQPITFALTGVIPGWTEGLQLMPAGSKYKFVIPHNLGYGAFDYGPIPGGSTLLFEIELLEVKKGQ